MYQIETSNFFFLSPRILTIGFWFLGYINNISNVDWLALRFYSRNRYELSYFLFKSRFINNNYYDVSFSNRCVALFSKYYSYFFTTNILTEDFFFLENALPGISITLFGFFFGGKITLLNAFSYYSSNTILDLWPIYLPIVNHIYISIRNYFTTIVKYFFLYMYFKSNSVFFNLLSVCKYSFFINGYY